MVAKVIYDRTEQVTDELATFAEACAVAVETAAQKGVKVFVRDGDGTTFLISAVLVGNDA